MNSLPHSGHAVMQYLAMRDTANSIADGYITEQFGAVVGKMKYDEESKLHYIDVTKLIDDIELSKTHVWEDGRVEKVF